MAQRRPQVSKILRSLEGVREVYFQPPASVQMVYPCIVYYEEPYDVVRADNGPYSLTDRYSATIVDPNPDTTIPTQLVKAFRHAIPDRIYRQDNLNHYTFTIYF